MERDLSEYLDKVDAAEAENLESVYLYDKAYDEGFAKAIDEFAEKLIGRLEESKKVLEEAAVIEMGTNGHTLDFENYNGGIGAVKYVITLVKHFAEQMKGGAE